MSTILWVRGEGIFSDSRYVNWIGDKQVTSFSSKIFTAKDKSFAYAYTGNLLVTSKKSVDEIITKWLEKNSNSRTVGKDRLPKIDDDKLLYAGDLIIILPNGDTWILTDKEGVLVTDQLEYWASGTGGDIVESYMELFGDPIKAMEMTKDKDPLTAGEIHQFLFDDFKNK